MKMIQVNIMADNSEIVHYDEPGIPLYVRKGLLSSYPGKRAACHWHDDLELILILSGEMNYYINGTTMHLKKDEAILVNTREMHYGFSHNNQECEFICILFHPSLLSACKSLFQENVTPFLDCNTLPYFSFNKQQHYEIINHILNIWEKKESKNPFYEFDIIGILYSLWASIISLPESSYIREYKQLSPDVLALRKMVSFIHDHYKEGLSLQDIADSASICRSKCCSVFSQQIHQSPFDFLNTYRLQISADLLVNTSLSITDIALECGFNHLSYYSKLFFRQYDCTPSEFRKLNV